MLYENKCARIAVVKCTLRPPKKNQLVKFSHAFEIIKMGGLGRLTRMGYRSHFQSGTKKYRVAQVDIPITYKKHCQQ